MNFNRASSLAGLSCRVVITGFFYEGFRRQAGELPQGFRVQRMFAFAWACDLWAWYVYTLVCRLIGGRRQSLISLYVTSPLCTV